MAKLTNNILQLQVAQASEIIQRQLNTALQQHGITLPPQLLQYNHNASTTQVDGAADVAEFIDIIGKEEELESIVNKAPSPLKPENDDHSSNTSVNLGELEPLSCLQLSSPGKCSCTENCNCAKDNLDKRQSSQKDDTLTSQTSGTTSCLNLIINVIFKM